MLLEETSAARVAEHILAPPFLTFGKNIGRVSGRERKRKEEKCGTHFAQPKALLLLPPGVVAYWGSPTLDCGGCHLRAFKMTPFSKIFLVHRKVGHPRSPPKVVSFSDAQGLLSQTRYKI